MISFIKDNNKRGTVGDILKNKIMRGSKLSIVSAYFTIYAYKELKEKMDCVESLDFLFGEPTFIKQMNPDLMKQKEFTIEDSTYEINLKNRLFQKSVAKECHDWIEKKVNIKSMKKPNFLHGKMYHIENPNRDPISVMGSSNFTYSGLGFGKSKNIELNLEMQDKRDILDLKNWFDEIWDDKTGLAEDVKDEVLGYLNKLYKENSPELVYLLTIYNVFSNHLEEEDVFLEDKIGFKETKIWNLLYDFQVDGVKGAIKKLEKLNGCILADSVGLGKTFEALAVIKYYELRNARVLVLCPKRLGNNWSQYKENVVGNIVEEDRFSYDIMYHTDLSREAGKTEYGLDISRLNWGNYNLVVIDESHNFRNNRAIKNKQTRYQKLMEEVMKKGIKTKVLLLSATPINNNLTDLKNQIDLITQQNPYSLSELGIDNIHTTLKRGQKKFTNWSVEKNKGEKKELLEALDSDFFKLLDEYTISRSKKHIEKFYDIDAIGKFPEREKPISIYSELDTKNKIMSYEDLNEIIGNLKFSIFYPSDYVYKRKEEEYSEKFDTTVKGGRSVLKQKDREKNLVQMMKINYLKRLESSINSFGISIDRLIEKIETLIEKIENYIDNKDYYKSLIKEKTRENKNDLSLFGEKEEEFDDDELELLEDLKISGKIEYDLSEMKVSEWLKDLRGDKKQLEKVLQEANKIDSERDKKLNKLLKLIEQKLKKPLNKGNKKVLIFTAYYDTAKYLYDNVKEWSVKQGINISLVSGGGNSETTFGKNNFENILTNFSPKSKGREFYSEMEQNEEIDILIATDCISEGQNLQDCDYLINYDIHWNPVRVIQRFGRIDRIGSKNKTIQLVNFWPTQDLNKYLNLEDRVKNRMHLLNLGSTGDENLFDTENDEENSKREELNFRHRQLLKLQEEVLDLEDINESISLTDFSLSDFKIEIANFLEENKNIIEKTPTGIYAVVPSLGGEYSKFGNYNITNSKVSKIINPGVIFCLKLKKDKIEKAGKKLEQFNPVSPYFLAYVYNDGEVKYNYSNIKQILEIYKLLCQGKSEVIEELCDVFNKNTNDGNDMKKYNDLILKMVDKIKGTTQKEALKSIGVSSGRGKIKLMKKSEKIKDEEEFDLISFLVIL